MLYVEFNILLCHFAITPQSIEISKLQQILKLSAARVIQLNFVRILAYLRPGTANAGETTSARCENIERFFCQECFFQDEIILSDVL